MATRLFWIETMSSTHVGTGRGLGYIDLPVHRESITGWPIIPGSSIKGVLADHYQATADNRKADTLVGLAFGKRPETDANGDQTGVAGALIPTDARLVCLPVRSFNGTFAYCTSAMALNRLRRDLVMAGVDGKKLPGEITNVADNKVYVGSANPDVISVGAPVPQQQAPAAIPAVRQANVPPGARRLGDAPNPAIQANHALTVNKVILDEYDFDALPFDQQAPSSQWADYLAKAVFETGWQDVFLKRFVVLPDTVFNQLCKVGLEVVTRVHIDETTGIVKDGQLWTEELLPPETILAGFVECTRVYGKGPQHTADELLSKFATGEKHLQMGGKASVGRGRVRCVFTNP